MAVIPPKSAEASLRPINRLLADFSTAKSLNISPNPSIATPTSEPENLSSSPEKVAARMPDADKPPNPSRITSPEIDPVFSVEDK